MKRGYKSHANSNGGGYKRGRVVRSYVPRGRFLNYRTGGLEAKELKFYDTQDTTVTWPALNNFVILHADNISTPPQGASGTTRVGRRFTVKSAAGHFKIYFGFSSDNAAPLVTKIFKIFLVKDKQTNKAPLTDANQVFTAGSVVAPMLNLENTDRFQVLESKTIVIEPNNTAPLGPNPGATYINWSGGAERTVSMYKKMHMNVLCEPGGTTAGAGTTMDNSLYYIIWTNRQANAGTQDNAPNFSAHTRVRFCC